ncbi:MAG: SNF2 helicase-associated domain-containing protein [Sulfuricellaceae bacterium]|nr:SNF2 helicase-associated domain-containing protein [Sulfuricellaceae bacterium]
MTRSAYGKTWWGEQWLAALTHLDYDNRLPRGRSYANKGAVRQLTVKAGSIQARVQGSRLYQVSITVPPITPKDAAKLLDRIAADPALIARMLNRELDPALLALAAELGIAVFPTRWTDLAMQCSCPDWAVPCKHLAAAIYLLSREIDGNPFLVFSLRGLDLAAALKTRNIQIESRAGAALPSLAELLPSGDERTTAAIGLLDGLDFSLLPELAEPLLRVLPEHPPFFPAGDFRAILGRLLARVAKAARQALDAAPSDTDEDEVGPLSPEDRPVLVLDADHKVTLTGMARLAKWPALVEALATLAPVRLADFQPELGALQPLRLLALHLLARGAVVPQVFALEGATVGLRWLPASLDPVVSELMGRVRDGLPLGLVTLRQGKKTLPLAPEAQATALCSLFLDHFIRAWSGSFREKPYGDPTLALFFESFRARYDGPGEGAIATGIHTWLSRFHLARREHSPLLFLDEGDAGNFHLSLAVENSRVALEPPVPLASVLGDPAWSQARYGILQTVSLLAEFFPPLNAYVSAGANAPLAIAAEALPGFLFDTLPVVRLLGIRALLPKALDRLLRPRLSMRITGTAPDSGGFLDAGDVFAFDWQVAVGEHRLTRAEFARLVAGATGVIRFKGGYVYLDPDEIEKLRAQLTRPPQLTGAELLRIALAGDYAGAPVRRWAWTRRRSASCLSCGNLTRCRCRVPSWPRCALTSSAATPGSTAMPGWAWAASSPTTWVWARPCKSSQRC